jgi:pimeloyl-ACP methyl ester carboxylesterase
VGHDTIIQANGVDLCVETFGDRADPAIVLIGGMGSAMDWWREEFCERIAAAGRFVIRYDLRDTGRSVTYEPGRPEYTGRDLVDDIVGLLDAFGLERAHLVGISMGGGIAQVLGVEHPDRVASLTLMSTSPGPDSDLPPMSERLRAAWADAPPEPDWTDREAVIDYVIADERPYAGSIPRDEADLRALVGRIVDRSIDMRSSTRNHALIDSGVDPVRPRLGEISVPTLVIHGTEDPLFPYGHGVALAKEIPGARLLPLEGVGHEVPPRQTWDVVVTALVAHTS